MRRSTRPRRVGRPARPRPGRWGWLPSGDRGSVTAEYAVVVLAAVAFAGVLVAVVRSGEVQRLLTGIIQDALTS